MCVRGTDYADCVGSSVVSGRTAVGVQAGRAAPSLAAVKAAACGGCLPAGKRGQIPRLRLCSAG
ncbi:unnamed protein product, partial [Rangifer tarandus platyrhynchus]